MIRRDFLRSLIAAPAAGLVQVPLVLTPEAFAQQGGGMALPEHSSSLARGPTIRSVRGKGSTQAGWFGCAMPMPPLGTV